MEIKDIIKKKIASTGLSKKEFAERMNINPSNLYLVLNSPSWPTLTKVAGALGISVSELVADDEPKKETESLVTFECPNCHTRFTMTRVDDGKTDES